MSTVAVEGAPVVQMPELDISELNNTSSDVMLRAISRNCVALKVIVGAISAERKVPGAKVSIGEHEVADELLSGARFKLVPSNIKNQLARVMNRARDVPYNYGTPFVGGAYLIPVGTTPGGKSQAQLAFEQLSQLKVDYRTLAENLKGDWEAHVQKVASDFPMEYDSMKKWFVSGDAFVRLHYISTMQFPLGAGLPVDFNDRLDTGLLRLLNNELLSAEDRAVITRLKPNLIDVIETAAHDVGSLLNEDTAATWVVEAQQATSKAVAEAVKTMIQEPVKEFAETLANFEGMLARGSNVRTGTVENLKTAFNKLKGFSFMVPDDLKTRLASVGSIINGVDYKEINSSESSSRELAKHFSEIREQLSSSEAHMAMYGKFMRNLDI
jgi:hypothetical protein